MAAETTLAEWYRGRENDLRELVPEAGVGVTKLTGSATWDVTLPVYLLGVAGVGKSSLINALLSDRLTVLPRGGVGPQTVCPIRVHYARDPRLTVTYADRSRLANLVHSLRSAPSADDISKARLLVEGSQFGEAPREYLTTSLADAEQGVLSPRARECDRGRLAVLAELFAPEGAVRVSTRHAGSDLPALLLDLQTHAAGFLSPLVTNVTIGWEADFLEPGLALVDLPGLGIANDSFRRATCDAVMAARCILVIVDRAGVTRDVADALASFFTEWIEDESVCRRFVVSVVKLDLIVSERRLRADGGPRRMWIEDFDAVATELVALVRGQLRAELSRLFPHASSERVDEIVRTVVVRPVAPIEHLRLSRQDPDDAARLNSYHDSRITALRWTLRGIAEEHRARVAGRLRVALDSEKFRRGQGRHRVLELQHELASLSR